MTQMERAEQRVARGAALLDLRKPGWEHRVVIPNLEMHSAHFCILGQNYGIYTQGRIRLFGETADQIMEEQQSIDHGFQSDGWVGYNALHEQWVMQIMARRDDNAQKHLDRLREEMSKEIATLTIRDEELVAV